MQDFIERLRAKPHHVRKHIALGSTLAVTGVVTLAWAVAFFASGKFTLSSGPTSVSVLAGSETNTSQGVPAGQDLSALLGSAGAAWSQLTTSGTSSALTIEDVSTSSPAHTGGTSANATDQTALPF